MLLGIHGTIGRRSQGNDTNLLFNAFSLDRSYYYISQFTVETCYFADGRCLFKQSQSVIYHWNQYDEEISKMCRSARLSVTLSVCNAT